MNNQLTAYFQQRPHLGVFIQARMGSKRLPEKMGKPFYGSQTIPMLLIERLLKAGIPANQLFLLTTNLPQDFGLVEVAERFSIGVHRGPVNDVLTRFVQAAHRFSKSTIVRVCADNPFLQPQYILPLLMRLEQENADYVTYQFASGLPAILSHTGLWSEVCSLSALKQVRLKTNKENYREHVTNYLYTPNSGFRCSFVPVPSPWDNFQDYRLTVDTETDFNALKTLYLLWQARPQSLPQLLLNNPECCTHMASQILANAK
ncbi:MAG: cytidylyltransferase domain-containing protein [Salibacteraceae bacterium]